MIAAPAIEDARPNSMVPRPSLVLHGRRSSDVHLGVPVEEDSSSSSLPFTRASHLKNLNSRVEGPFLGKNWSITGYLISILTRGCPAWLANRHAE
jgi:hypothetical protein